MVVFANQKCVLSSTSLKLSNGFFHCLTVRDVLAGCSKTKNNRFFMFLKWLLNLSDQNSPFNLSDDLSNNYLQSMVDAMQFSLSID